MKRKNSRLAIGLTFWFSLIIFIENLIAVGISTLSVSIINVFSNGKIYIESEILVFIFSVLFGGVLSFATIKIFLKPIRKLNKNMSLVSKGDFTIRTKGKSRIKEIGTMYQSFNKMVAELGTMETVQSDFISNVSHEFKTPISAIEGYSMLLQDCTDKEEQEKYIQKILLNTNRLSSLVGDVLLLSKLDNQVIKPKYTKFSLDEQIRKSILFLEIAWEEKEIEFEVNLEEAIFNGTEDLMLHVWNNIIGNAIKFTPNNGKIIVSLEKLNSSYIVKVSDSGLGIDEKDIDKVFNKFFQGETVHKSKGSGLGLPLAKKIVLINNGEITVENKVGGGCVFTVILNNNL